MSQKKNTKDLTDERLEAVEEALTKSEQIIEKYQKTILLAIGVIVFVVVAYFAFDKYYIQPKEDKAQVEMAWAESYFGMDSLQMALEGKGINPGFLDIIDQYGMTKSANLAKYYAGICYLKMGKYNEAIKNLKGFKADDKIVAPMAMGVIGDAYFELGETDKAITYYLDAANQNKNGFTSPLFFQKAALAYEAENEYSKALDIHERIAKDFATSNEGRQAEKYIVYLKSKLGK